MEPAGPLPATWPNVPQILMCFGLNLSFVRLQRGLRCFFELSFAIQENTSCAVILKTRLMVTKPKSNLLLDNQSQGKTQPETRVCKKKDQKPQGEIRACLYLVL